MTRHLYVVHKYKSRCDTVGQPPGLGDFLQGTASLHMLSLIHGFKLRLDVSDHPLGHVLSKEHECFSNDYMSYERLGEQEFFNNLRLYVANYVADFVRAGREGYVVVCSHMMVEGHATIKPSTKELIQSLLMPSAPVEVECTAMMSRLHIRQGEFRIFHIRSGDRFRKWDVRELDGFVNDLETKFRQQAWDDQYTNPIVVMSDSYVVKKRLAERFGCLLTDVSPCHLGSQCFFDAEDDRPPSASTSDEMIKGTYLEFLIMMKASVIYTYSFYGGSNFMRTLTQFYHVDVRQVS